MLFRIEQKDVSTETGFARHTTADWANFCREVCINEVINQETRIGGVGNIVEIDESLFRKKKFGRGELHDGQWVFGGVQRGSGECFLVPVERRDAETLVPLIVKHIVPGTTIYPDKWKAYSRLEY
jgi:ISXO2-like transposase domain